MKRLLLFAAILGTLVAPRSVSAAPIIGAQLVATGGDVIAQFMGHTAGFTNELYLFDVANLGTPLAVTATVGGRGPGVIFNNQTTPVGTTLNLGAFAPGTELVFAIYVQNTGNTFYMGPAARNVDLVFHGAVDNGLPPQFPSYGVIPPGFTAVGFEDILGGGDLDYDDLGFAFSNVRATVAPEPVTLSLLALGLAGVGARRMRQRA
jgi:hypothetical protein